MLLEPPCYWRVMWIFKPSSSYLQPLGPDSAAAAGYAAYSNDPASAVGVAAHLAVLVGLDPWRGLSYCYRLIINREGGPQKYIQNLASNCSENSEIGFLLCCVADRHVSRQLEKLNSHYQPGPCWTSEGKVFGLGCGGGSRVVRLLMLHSHRVCDDEMNWLMSA